MSDKLEDLLTACTFKKEVKSTDIDTYGEPILIPDPDEVLAAVRTLTREDYLRTAVPLDDGGTAVTLSAAGILGFLSDPEVQEFPNEARAEILQHFESILKPHDWFIPTTQVYKFDGDRTLRKGDPCRLVEALDFAPKTALKPDTYTRIQYAGLREDDSANAPNDMLEDDDKQTPSHYRYTWMFDGELTTNYPLHQVSRTHATDGETTWNEWREAVKTWDAWKQGIIPDNRQAAKALAVGPRLDILTEKTGSEKCLFEWSAAIIHMIGPRHSWPESSLMLGDPAVFLSNPGIDQGREGYISQIHPAILALAAVRGGPEAQELLAAEKAHFAIRKEALGTYLDREYPKRHQQRLSALSI